MDAMGLDRARAWAHLCEWTKTDALRKHARAVEVVMRAAALRHGAGPGDVERFGLAGMLHDADYEAWPEEHPRRIVAWLVEHGEPEVAHAVSAHYTKWGVPYESPLDKALLACDELTGLIMAAAYVRPDRDLHSVQLASIKKKWKDKAFTAAIDRKENMEFIEELGVPFDEHVQRVLTAMQGIAGDLGLDGA